ncbi:hypothetical protein [Dactylosporangium darangshiense]
MDRYIGSGPYCYANSLAMVLGPGAPPPAVLEVLTGSPFGFELLAGLPFFDPYGWDPDRGLDDAIGLLGWSFRRTGAAGGAEALATLRAALRSGRPALVGPVEMGLFRHQPFMNGPIGADHFVAVLEVDDDLVRFHDPHGFPYATLPVADFLAAWRAETIAYRSTEYTIRFDFHHDRAVGADTALRAALPGAVAWLRGEGGTPPPGTLGGAEGVQAFAAQVEAGLPDGVHGHLVHFAIRCGARRLADAADALDGLGLAEAAEIATHQARLVGGLQYPVMTGDTKTAAALLRELAPTYEALAVAIDKDIR